MLESFREYKNDVVDNVRQAAWLGTLAAGGAVMAAPYIKKKVKDQLKYTWIKYRHINRPVVAGTLVQKLKDMAPIKRSKSRGTPSRSASRIPVGNTMSFPSTPKGTRKVVKILDTPRRGPGKQQLVYNRGRPSRKGTFRGKFKKMKKVRTSIFNRAGVVYKNELYGKGDDENAIYVKAEACPAEDAIRALVGALVRKILEKAGFRCTSWDSYPTSFMGVAGSTSSMYRRLQLYNQNMVNQAISALIFADLENLQFKQIVDVFVPIFKAYIAGSGQNAVNNRYRLLGFAVEERVRNEADDLPFRNIETLLFSQCSVLIKATLDLKVQNRTLSATGDPDAEDVAANPLQGYMYMFNGVPKPKVAGDVSGGVHLGSSFKFENYYTQFSGVSLFNPQTMDASYKEPPKGSAFWNCSKARKIVLDPGVIKHFRVSDGYKNMTVDRILNTIHFRTVDDGPSDFYFWNNKKNLMFGFEDVISVNANPVSIAFEAERSVSAVCFEKKKSYMLPSFNYQEVTEI